MERRAAQRATHPALDSLVYTSMPQEERTLRAAPRPSLRPGAGQLGGTTSKPPASGAPSPAAISPPHFRSLPGHARPPLSLGAGAGAARCPQPGLEAPPRAPGAGYARPLGPQPSMIPHGPLPPSPPRPPPLASARPSPPHGALPRLAASSRRGAGGLSASRGAPPAGQGKGKALPSGWPEIPKSRALALKGWAAGCRLIVGSQVGQAARGVRLFLSTEITSMSSWKPPGCSKIKPMR